MRKDVQDKKNRLQELFAQQREIEQEIERLLSPETVVALPADFSLNSEVTNIVNEHPTGITTKQIFANLTNKFPTYSIERKRVNSSIVYLSNSKKLIKRIGQGIYTPSGVQKNSDNNEDQ